MNQCERILQVLRDGRWHTHLELYALGVVLHSRISELRDPDGKYRLNIEIRTRSEYVPLSRGRKQTIYDYRLVGSLDAAEGEGLAAVGRPAGDASSGSHLSAASSEPTLDEYGVTRAAAELNDEFPGMLLEDGVPVSDSLPLEVQRAELAKFQQTLFGERRAA